MEAPVFWEKVRSPDPRGLRRARLEERVLGPDAPPIALVLGPPGSGKTTLLSWVSANTGTPSAWYRADGEDRDENALVRHLAHAVETATGRTGWAAGVATVTALVAALQDEPRPLALVLDDVHELAGQPAERALERLVALRPRQVRLLLGSRRPPAVNVSRLLVSGELVQLDAEDLRFRSWETEELFRAVYAEPLSPETAAALTRRTGGWAAGLQLFHLGSGGLGRAERERAVAELSGRSRLIRSYLARNVLSGLDDERRRFLLHTSTLGVLTGDTCDALLQTTGSAAVLDELEQQHFFTSSLDDGRTFRYHQVLQTHLEVVLSDELGAESVRALYARSAALLERSGRTSAAVRAYARAEDWAALARVLPQGLSALLPDDVLGAGLDDPGLLVARARRLLVDGRLTEAVGAFRRAEASMDDLEFRQRCAADRRLADLLGPRSEPHVHDTGSPVHRAAAEVRGATLDLRGREGFTTGLGRAVGGLLAGDLDDCAAGLVRVRTGRPGPVPTLVGDLVAELAGALGERRPPSLAALEGVVSAAEQAGLPFLARLGRGLQAATLLLDDPSEGHLAACADLLDDDGGPRGDPWSGVLVALAVGAAALLAGTAAAQSAGTRWLERARGDAARLDAPVLAAWAGLLLGPRGTGEPGDKSGADGPADRAAALGILPTPWLRTGLRPWGRERPAVRAPTPTTAPTTAPDRVALHTLGGFAVEIDGRELHWAGLRPRAQSLLMMLASRHQRPIHRERLIDALWPDVALGPGVRSLQVAVSSIRHCLAAAGLGDGVLDRLGEAYVLRLPGCDDQRAGFEELAATADRAATAGDPAVALDVRVQALARYGGDLLPEAGPAEWVVGERARLTALAVRVALGAARLALQLDDPATAAETAARAVELDPYADSGWLLLETAHERSGDRTAARRVRREHDRVSGELGLVVDGEPSEPSALLLSPPRRTTREERARA